MVQARVVAGRYELIRPLGRGGMGAVWLGKDVLAGREVAVKELRPPNGTGEDERDVFRKRALQEARSAARLAHQNAVTLHDIVPATAADDAVYLIMEYVDGATLAQVVRREGPLSEARVSSIALQLLSILEASHALGIVHRDIKPSNIMVTAAGQVKLTDFGIAHVADGTRLTGSGVIGTPAYMAPEQLQGLAVTPAVDLWALGVTLFDAVHGRNPFERETTAATFHAILMAELPVPACAPPLASVIAGMLVRDPEQRITVAQARQLLAGATAWNGVPTGGGGIAGAGPRGPAGAAQTTHPGSPAQFAGQGQPATLMTVRPAPRRRTAVIAGSAVAVAAAAAAVIAMTVLHSGSPGAPSAGKPSVIAGSAAASPTAPGSSAVAASSAGSAGAVVPSAYVGRWQGTLADNTGLEGPQAADLTITGGGMNSVVGKVSYPNIGCTYDFRLVSAQPDRVMLYEQVKSGLCQSEYVVLTPMGSGITENVFAGPPSGGQPDFTGRLSRVG
ncbi:MAG TPA: serine/threonine-protein kinase [Trebonia sp.]